MASRGSSLSAFQHINTPRCVVNSSFSIRSILDLPEENAENCAGSSRNDSPDGSYSVSLPLVPQVVRPMLHNYVDSAPRSTLRNWQDLGFAPYSHHWGYGAVSIAEQKYPMGISVFPKKRRRPMRKKKQRPLFSPHQIQTMEKEFAKQRYVTEDKRAELALEVNLTETQVKTWFQNRRTKWKKESRDEASATTRRPSHEDIEHVAFATQRINPFCQNVCINSLLNPLRVVTPYCNAPIFSTFASNPTFVSQFTL